MTPVERIKVMVVDDYSIVRVGLKQVLEQSGEFEVWDRRRMERRRSGWLQKCLRTWW